MQKNNLNTPSPFTRLQTELSQLIASTPPGERLMAEPELAKQMGVSRATLREAMRTFEGQGVIRRRQGIGTFVVNHSHVIETGLEVLESIETLASRIGLPVSMGDVAINRVEADAELAEALSVPEKSLLMRVSRVISAAGRPVAYLVDVLPEDVLSAKDLEKGFRGSVLDLLLKRGSPSLVNSYTDIAAVEAPATIARALEIQRRDTLLNFTARLYDASGRVIAYSSSYFLPGYFRFHVIRRVGQ